VVGIDEVLERLRSDPSFRELLVREPQEALAAYELTTADLRAIAVRVLGSRPKAPGLAAFFDAGLTDGPDERGEIE
jgi:hypothetical protein